MLKNLGRVLSDLGRREDALVVTEQAGALSRRFGGEAPAPGLEALTRTERRVAVLIAEGLNNHQIARRMGISRHTVDSHLRRIFGRLGIRSRVELARLVERS